MISLTPASADVQAAMKVKQLGGAAAALTAAGGGATYRGDEWSPRVSGATTRPFLFGSEEGCSVVGVGVSFTAAAAGSGPA